MVLCFATGGENRERTVESIIRQLLRKAPAAQLKAEIERCHQELIEKPDKPERRLLLQIIDCTDQIAEDLSLDSFIVGFCLAMQLSQELNMYDKGRSASTDWVEQDAL